MSRPTRPARGLSVYAAPLLALCMLAVPASSSAQAYPVKPVRWVIPFAAGGPFDLLARGLSKPMSESMGQPMVIEVRPSTSGIIGAEVVAKAAPDGYTLLTHGSLVPQKFLYRSLLYDVQRDFAPITIIAKNAMMLFVHPSVPAKNLDELVAYAKANPGKLNYGSSGLGQSFHLGMELLKQRTGMDIVHIPYKGSAQTMTEVVANRVQAMFFTPVGQMVTNVRSGKLRAIAIAGDKRLEDLPDVPTFAESGIRDFDPSGGIGVFAPAGTPKDIIDRLNREIVRAIGEPATRKLYAQLNMNAVTTTPEQYAQFIQDEIGRWGPVIKSLGISLD